MHSRQHQLSHKAVVWLLLEKDMDANIHGGHYDSVFQVALAGSHKAVV